MKRIAILGSTGSIGLSALDVVRAHPETYRIVGLAAGSNADLLQRQAREFNVEHLALSSPRETVDDNIITGGQAACELIKRTAPDMVLNGIAGAAGFLPSLTAVRLGADLALANKESLVIGGTFLTAEAKSRDVKILPVDSEHSAIFQCLQGEEHNPLRRIILTASGGPFRTREAATFKDITPAEALAHPTWDMGRRITVDSATMMNKALEIIEACWLFQVPVEQITVAIHPQSIVHSMVEFADRSIKAQMGYPDMRVPIAYALSWPERRELPLAPLDFNEMLSLQFFPPDEIKFPALRIAHEAMKAPGVLPCIMNAADEMAVEAFFERRIRFDEITAIVEKTMDSLAARVAQSPEELIALDQEARATARGFTK